MAECECGRTVAKGLGCCERCYYLDGGKVLDIIQELRTSEPCSVAEIAAATGRKRATVHTSLLRLLRRGRVSQIQPDDIYGAALDGWLYVLVDRQESAA